MALGPRHELVAELLIHIKRLADGFHPAGADGRTLTGRSNEKQDVGSPAREAGKGNCSHIHV